MAKSGDSTQRAYTLKLGQGAGPSTWKQELWKSHEFVNKGAYAVGNWFLTMAGGLDHQLADETDPTLDDPEKRQRQKQRRIILALSWLTVERGRGLPDKKYQIPDALASLREILRKRGLSEEEIRSWVSDCQSSLSANKREDAVWVNRSALFDDVVKKCDLTREDAASFVFGCLGEDEAKARADYFAMSPGEEGASRKRAQPKNMTQTARSWLSRNWGSGTKTDPGKIQTIMQTIIDADLSLCEGTTGAATLIHLARLVGSETVTTAEQAIESIKAAAGFRGRTNIAVFALQKIANANKISSIQLEQLKTSCQKLIDKWQSKPKTSSKAAEAARQYLEHATGCPYRTDRADQTNQFSAFFDLALRRISSYRTWVQRAEEERQDFAQKKQSLSTIPSAAEKWLSDYTSRRTEETGALESCVLRSTAVGDKHKWKALVGQWKTTDPSDERTRQDMVKQAQAEDTEQTFGDARLFNELSGPKAWPVWHREDGTPDATILENYVDASEAEEHQRHFKVPCYCHPDSFEHPVFPEYGNSRWNATLSLQERDPQQRHAITLETWTGTEFKDMTIEWMSHRFSHDFALQEAPTPDGVEVSRADRLGRAAAGVRPGETVYVPSSNKTPIRLQLDRNELRRTEKFIKTNPDKATEALEHLNWFVTVSMPLTPRGPWISYAKQHDLPATAQYPFAGDNKNRGMYAKKVLEGMPHLRVLGVDMGLRYGAACTVLETLSAGDIADACDHAGQSIPGSDTLYFQLTDPKTHRRTWYRRIGPDAYPMIDQSTGEAIDTNYPAPWARFDRQFTIKLPGEKDDTRMATPREIGLVNSFRLTCGMPSLSTHRIDVASLMLLATTDLRRAVKRHGDLARIAYYLTATEQIQPGGRRVAVEASVMVIKAVSLLVNIVQSPTEANRWAREAWQKHVATMDNTLPEPADEKWQKDSDTFAHRAAVLLIQNSLARSELARGVTEAWKKEDGAIREQLRFMRDWIFGQAGKTDRQSVLHTGGLSIDRLSAMQNLYQVSKAYYVRLGPDGHAANRACETVENAASAPEEYGQRMLDALEQVREARARQLASRIAEAALGIGREPSSNDMHTHTPARMCLPDSDQRYAPCQAVVIENLTNYRPDDQHPHRENRQLMQWAVHKVQDYLTEECLLHGIFLQQVTASYTSRQDCLSGAPGCRCNDMPPARFMAMKLQPKKAYGHSSGLAGEHYEQAMLDRCQRGVAPCSIRVIRGGGEIFVSSDPTSPLAVGIQADINASANIALRAVMEHDWPGRWWYVLVNSKTRRVVAEKYKGIHAVPDIALGAAAQEDQKRPDKQVNAWRMPDTTPLRTARWYSTGTYWKNVADAVAVVLQCRFVEDIDKER